MPYTIVNATTSAASVFPSMTSWVYTLGIMILIIVVLFFLCTNLKNFFIGGIVSALLFGIYKLSRYISISSTVNNNQVPLHWTIGISVFILLSILIGIILNRIPYTKKLLEFDIEQKNNKEDP